MVFQMRGQRLDAHAVDARRASQHHRERGGASKTYALASAFLTHMAFCGCSGPRQSRAASDRQPDLAFHLGMCGNIQTRYWNAAEAAPVTASTMTEASMYQALRLVDLAVSI